jgi:hypothetical protein
MWEVIFMVLVLKIPMAYVCWVVWWAIRAEPSVEGEGEEATETNWKPWRRPEGPRPRRGAPHGPREDARATRRRERADA